jgi:low affinity Fe/Cu permease
MKNMQYFFAKIASRTAKISGNPFAFIVSLTVIIIWALTGPIFNYGDTWQLVINTGTTIFTFLMVFLIQNSQNRDAEAIQIKLDELLRSDTSAHNVLLDIESLTLEELDELKQKYSELAKIARANYDHETSKKYHQDIKFDTFN